MPGARAHQLQTSPCITDWEISASNNIKSCETRCFNWQGEALIEIRTVTSKNEERIRTF